MLLAFPTKKKPYGAPSSNFFEMKSKISGSKLNPNTSAYNAIKQEVEDIIGDSISRLKGTSWVFYGLSGYTYGLDADGNLYIVGGKNSHKRGDYRLATTISSIGNTVANFVAQQINPEDPNSKVTAPVTAPGTNRQEKSSGTSTLLLGLLATSGVITAGVILVKLLRKK